MSKWHADQGARALTTGRVARDIVQTVRSHPSNPGLLSDDWRGRAMKTHEAVHAVERYLDAMHRGMATQVTFGARPPCCSLDDLITREAPPLSEGYAGGFDSAATLVSAASSIACTVQTLQARTPRWPARLGRSS